MSGHRKRCGKLFGNIPIRLGLADKYQILEVLMRKVRAEGWDRTPAQLEAALDRL